MDDPFGHAVFVLLFFALAAIMRVIAVSVPFIDESEARKQGESARQAQRTLRLLRRAGDEPFGEIQMAYIWLLLCACVAACIWFSGGLTAWLTACFPGLGARTVRVAAGVILIIPFSLAAFVFAGVIPGYLAAHFREKLFHRVAAIADWTLILLSPLTRLSILLGRLLLRPFHITPVNTRNVVTEEGIRMMVDIGEEKGAIEADEKEMIENIFEFNNMDAEDCMIHRKDITAIDIDSDDAEIFETIRESGLSRFPVYEDSIDNILGILTSRDYLISKCAGSGASVRDLVRPAYFVPESVRTDVLFREMQTHKQHMAIVVDEYGGTSGLITLEDLLEEIVGNIYDEFDPKEEQDITPLPDGRCRVSGSADLESVAEAMGVELPAEEEYDTLGGLVFSRLAEIPADGERPVVECFGLRVSVEEIADRRVEWAIVEKLTKDKDEERQ